MGTRWGKVKVDISQVYAEVTSCASSFPEVEAVLLFGSRARQEETPLSDVDLAYLLEKGLAPSTEAEIDTKLYNGISRILGTDEITLLDLGKAPLSIAFSVFQEGRVLFSRNPQRLAALQERTLILYPEIHRFRTETLAEFERSLKGGQMDVSRERILYYLRFVKEEVTRLKELANLTKEEYLANSDSQIVAERRFQRAVESCLNIGNHIISKQGLRLAEDYASVFRVLAESHIISGKLAERMSDMARFRNLLVHVYWNIDHEKIYEQMPERISALDSFIDEIHTFIT
ncbi:MAG: DUF86 domain-containing protein [Chloroflexi bacterium]|nr:DUF86 domain-containing protein [Chloroflexota bacterium]